MSFSKILILIISIQIYTLPTFAIVKIKDTVPQTPFLICLQKNEDSKKMSIKQARLEYETAVKNALNIRNESVEYILSLPNKDEQEILKEKTYSEYKDAQSFAQNEYLTLRKLALKKYDSEQRKCRAQTIRETDGE